jgi:hypothetical protein
MEDNKLANIEFKEIGGNPVVKSQNAPFVESFYFSKFYEEKAYRKFVQSIEKLIRTSREYKGYVELLRTNLSALNVDNILSNITNADAEMEFHHYPYTLYEVVDAVCASKFLAKEKFTSFSVAKDVLDLHYQNKIGLVPLTKTNHELAHDGSLFISRKQVFGEYGAFGELYEEAIGADVRDRIRKMEEDSDANRPSDVKGLF